MPMHIQYILTINTYVRTYVHTYVYLFTYFTTQHEQVHTYQCVPELGPPLFWYIHRSFLVDKGLLYCMYPYPFAGFSLPYRRLRSPSCGRTAFWSRSLLSRTKRLGPVPPRRSECLTYSMLTASGSHCAVCGGVAFDTLCSCRSTAPFLPPPPTPPHHTPFLPSSLPTVPSAKSFAEIQREQEEAMQRVSSSITQAQSSVSQHAPTH